MQCRRRQQLHIRHVFAPDEELQFGAAEDHGVGSAARQLAHALDQESARLRAVNLEGELLLDDVVDAVQSGRRGGNNDLSKSEAR